jgi:hypothetical protein
MTGTAAVPAPTRALRTPVAWGVVLGVLQAASPVAFPWLDPATVYALGLALIAAVYVGFAVADGRRHVLVVETAVAALFVVSPQQGRPARPGCSSPAWPATASRTPGSTAPGSSAGPGGGHRSAPRSTGSRPG